MAKKIPKKEELIAPEQIESQISDIRGQKVILDYDLATIYGVTTKRLNEQVKRNPNRFPAAFSFQVKPEEIENLRSRIATSNDSINRSQFATGSQRHRNPRYLPYAFTEHGAIMAATVLNTPRAVQMSVFVVRAFVKMRQILIAQSDLAKKLVEIEKKLTARLDIHETAIVEVLQQVMTFLSPPPDEHEQKPGEDSPIGLILCAGKSEEQITLLHFLLKRWSFIFFLVAEIYFSGDI